MAIFKDTEGMNAVLLLPLLSRKRQVRTLTAAWVEVACISLGRCSTEDSYIVTSCRCHSRIADEDKGTQAGLLS